MMQKQVIGIWEERPLITNCSRTCLTQVLSPPKRKALRKISTFPKPFHVLSAIDDSVTLPPLEITNCPMYPTKVLPIQRLRALRRIPKPLRCFHAMSVVEVLAALQHSVITKGPTLLVARNWKIKKVSIVPFAVESLVAFRLSKSINVQSIPRRQKKILIAQSAIENLAATLKAHQTAKNHGLVKATKQRRPDNRGDLMDVDAFKKTIRKELTMGFSKQHETLLKICFGVVKPDPSEVKPLSLPYLGESDVQNMIYMNLVEFAASFEKELLTDSGQQDETNPKPYDVFLVSTAVGEPECIAACLPRKKSDVLWWYDGGRELIPLDDRVPKRKIASMSGPSRVLESLSKTPLILTQNSMNREMIVDAVEDYNSLQQFQEDSDLIDRIQKLNQSQQLALATLTSQHFTRGFQPIIGPPGMYMR